MQETRTWTSTDDLSDGERTSMKNVGAMVWSTVCPVFVETPPDIFEEAQTRLSATRHVDIKLKSHLQAVHALLLAVSGGGASRLWRDELPLAMFDQLRNRLPDC